MDKKHLAACRGILIYVTAISIFLLSALLLGKAYLPANAFLLLLICHSTVRVFAETTPHLRDTALLYREEHEPHERTMKTILRALLSEHLILLEFAVLLLMPLLMPLELGLLRFAKPMMEAGLPRLLAKLIVVVAFWHLLLPLGLLSYYYAFLWWLDHRPTDKPLLITRLLRLAGILAIYLVGGFVLRLFLPVFISIYYIAGAGFEVGGYLRPAILIGILLLLFSARYLRAWRIRRRFFKALKQTAAASGATLSPILHPYRSLLRVDHEPSFTVTMKGKRYVCLLLGALRRHNPLFFSETGKVQCLHSYRFRRVEFFRYTTEYNCSFTADGTKCIIVVPVSREIYAGHTGFFRQIDTGERVGDYHIHTATGFLGALSRDVLDKHG